MLVLVSNDDGIDAPGIHALVARVSEIVGTTIIVAAPERERSASGHCITISEDGVTALPAAVPGACEAYAISGSPADCVMLALSPGARLFKTTRSPDLVLSGVNKGK
jgi:5'-nucleotidase